MSEQVINRAPPHITAAAGRGDERVGFSGVVKVIGRSDIGRGAWGGNKSDKLVVNWFFFLVLHDVKVVRFHVIPKISGRKVIGIV